MEISPNMGLSVWTLESDPYNHAQLADNFKIIDEHQHQPTLGLPVVTEGIASEAVTFSKIAKGAVHGGTSGNILNGTITGGINGNIANHTITSENIVSSTFNDIVPIGTIINWFRPNQSVPIPQGFAIPIGQTISESEHEFPTLGSVTLPDLRNRFVLGAEPNGASNPTPSQIPGENIRGGSNEHNLAHTHTINPHSHYYTHTHHIPIHTHTIATDGLHIHFWEGKQLHQRSSAFGSPYLFKAEVPLTLEKVTVTNGANESFFKGESLFPGEEKEIPIEAAGLHNHGGQTAPSESLITSSQSTDITEATELTTNTNSLLSTDNRPAFIGLIFLIKLKAV